MDLVCVLPVATCSSHILLQSILTLQLVPLGRAGGQIYEIKCINLLIVLYYDNYYGT